jgi:hypothetical protein
VTVLFGRKYRVIVASATSGGGLDVSQLKCRFTVAKTLTQDPNYSDITIYNLSAESEGALIMLGSRVILEAGYEGQDHYGCIFDGQVVQSIRSKEKGTDYLLTLVCLDGDGYLNQNLIQATLAAGQSARTIAESCVTKAEIPAYGGAISTGLSEQKLARGRVLFGAPSDILRQVAQSNQAQLYVEDGTVHIIKAPDVPSGEAIRLTPETGLVGSVEQTEDGCRGICLLNPRIRLNTLLSIPAQSVVARHMDKDKSATAISQGGIYRVAAITHKGDTRGDDWYTQFEAVVMAGYIPANIESANQNPF